MGDVVSYVNLRRFAPCDVRRSTFIKGDVVKGDVVSHVDLLILRDRGTRDRVKRRIGESGKRSAEGRAAREKRGIGETERQAPRIAKREA